MHVGAQHDAEVLIPPVSDDPDEMQPGCASWQLLSVSLHRAHTLGFGIAVSGGRDNPHFTSGDPAVVISDVVPSGPAWGLLQVNDRILSANGVSFESIDYATAVDIIKNADKINMIVKRKVPLPVMEFEQRTLKFTLSKSRKKEDFGIVLGCRFYIKEIRNPKLAEKDPGLREGDSVLRINGQSVDGATLEDVNKWLERSREKLCLVIQRDVRRGASRWPSQNTVYERLGSVNATPRHSPSPLIQHPPLSNRSSHEYINSPRWRDGSLDERRVSSPAVSGTSAPLNGEYEYYNRGAPRPDSSGVRSVAFRKVGGSVGVRVIGGNEVGIFVSAVAADSPAALHGVCCGDKILEVNGRSMRGISRESAVQLLLQLEDRVSLRLEHARQEFEHVRNAQLGDNFFVRAHFSKEKKNSPLELTINEGDIFHVTDTLFGGTVGLWQAARVYSSAVNKGDPASNKGVIPNQISAETMAREQRRAAEKGKGTLLRRKLEQRRTKSLPKNFLADPAELSGNIPSPAYERVALTTPSFHRPIVLFGPLADVARQQLLAHFSMHFAEPESDGGVFRLAAVDSVISSGKHCVMDISIESVERLQLARYAPIVVLIDIDGRSRIRELRKKLNAPHVSSKKLAEQASQIKKHHAHLLSATVDATQEEGWFDALRDLVVHLQQRRLWMPEFAPNMPLEDVLLFPLSTRMNNYDSDMESLKGDYSDYVTHRDDARLMPAPMSQSIYDWDPCGSTTVVQADGPAAGERRGWTTLPRRPIERMHVNGKDNGSSPAGPSPAPGTPTKPLNGEGKPPNSGYYHVKQLLNDDSLYQDARLANEIANVRLKEEARLREERIREEHRQQMPFQPPNPDMYSPRQERLPAFNQRTATNTPNRPLIAPKPNLSRSDAESSRIDSPGMTNGNSSSHSNHLAPLRMNGSISPLPSKMSPSPAPLAVEENGNLDDGKEDEPAIIEQASASVGSEGATICCPASKVELRVPPGAIPEGEVHEIHVKVFDEGDAPPIDKSKGETLLSPLVKCGPKGLTFSIPCELRLPHSGLLDSEEQWSLSVKAGDSGGKWNHMDGEPDSKGDGKFLVVPISRF